MLIKKLPCVLLFLMCCFAQSVSYASHLRAGEIIVERINCQSLTFRITITVYIDTGTGVTFGGFEDWLDFGDGNRTLVPEQVTIPRPDLGPNMGMASYTKVYSYSGPSSYTISYTEPYRNGEVINITNPDANRFHVETFINLDPALGCNDYVPKLKVPPIDRGCVGVAFFHNPYAYDLDGDSVSFELAIPQREKSMEAQDYKDPNNAKFYLNYAAGNEEKNGVPTFSINPKNGTLLWNAPGTPGEYNIAFRIVEWGEDNYGVMRRISYVTRDMQIIVEDCDNNRPDVVIPEDTCIVAGASLRKVIFGTDPDKHPVKIEVYSEATDVSVSAATYNPRPAAFQPSVPPAQLNFEWNTDCAHVREQPYYVVFKITDNPPRGPKLVTFKTWRIRVIAPAPLWSGAAINQVKRTATLQWNDYICKEAHLMQVWRKVEGTTFVPGACETGMPATLGYSLVSTVAIRDQLTGRPISQFVDNNGGAGLAPGAAYCYRLVALFPRSQGGGESYVSDDMCLDVVKAIPPVITTVTVEQTDAKDGVIRVGWYGPFDINKTQYPGPYEYEVYRAGGFTGNDAIRVTPANRIKDTTFLDTGLDTRNEVYNYRIVLYSNTASDPATWIAVDTSAVASSVWMEARGLPDGVALGWKAEVPWSNASERFPYHLVYRGTAPDGQAGFTLIDSIMAQNGFTYRDQGQYNNTPLNKDQTYCYRILTRGVYGNPAMREPFENFSQVICRKPDEDARPCVPALSITVPDCDELFASSQCMVKNFTNRISWHTACADNVRSYRIYSAAGPDRDFVLIADNVKDTLYIDRQLASFARCYKITAVDALGIESDWSETVCNDNCPYFELPNIFTPNGDGCNEYFSAYGPFNPLNQDSPESCDLGYANYSKCLRFVTSVSFRVYNRWGKEVYSYRSTGEETTYINWNGRDKDGRSLATGTYYYSAVVVFDVMQPDKRQQTFKGWVQLVN